MSEDKTPQLPFHHKQFWPTTAWGTKVVGRTELPSAEEVTTWPTSPTVRVPSSDPVYSRLPWSLKLTAGLLWASILDAWSDFWRRGRKP